MLQEKVTLDKYSVAIVDMLPFSGGVSGGQLITATESVHIDGASHLRILKAETRHTLINGRGQFRVH